MSLLDPLSHALAGVIASAHSGLASLGLDPSVRTHLGAQHRCRRRHGPAAAAPADRARRTDGACVGARAAPADGAGRALPRAP